MKRRSKNPDANMTQLQLAKRDREKHERHLEWLAAIDKCVDFLVAQVLREHVLQYQHVGSKDEFERIHRGVMGRLIRHAIAMKKQGQPRWYDDSETDAEKRLLYILPQRPLLPAPAKPKPKAPAKPQTVKVKVA